MNDTSNNKKQYFYDSSDIDFSEVIKIIYASKFFILIFSTIVTLLFGFISISIPDKYTSSVLLKVNNDTEEKQNITGLGALTGIAGINDTGNIKANVFIETVKSKIIIREILNENKDFKQKIIAAKRYDYESDKILYKRNIFNNDKKTWVRNPPKGRIAEPSYIEIHEFLSSEIIVDQNSETGFILVSYTHISPKFSHLFLDTLINTVNQITKRNDLMDSNKALDYLYERQKNVTQSDIRSSINNLIIEQLKINMLANINQFYLVTPVDPAVVPELKSSPNRILIVTFGFIIGLFLSISVCLIRDLYKKS